MPYLKHDPDLYSLRNEPDFITLIQDGTGSRTLAVGDQYFGAGGEVPEISTAANAIDIIPYVVIAAGKILLGSAQKAFSDAS